MRRIRSVWEFFKMVQDDDPPDRVLIWVAILAGVLSVALVVGIGEWIWP